MANLRVNLDTAVFNVLNVASVLNEATGGVFNGIAPQGTTPPYVVFQAMSKVDDWPKSAGDIDTQVDSVMQDASLSVTGHSLLWCRREEDIYLAEDQQGVIYQHIGGLYRIRADQS